MKLLFILGRDPILAQKEIGRVATILPFLWSTTMVRENLLQLKEVNDKGEGKISPDLAASLTALQRRLGGTQRIVWPRLEAGRQELAGRIFELLADGTGAKLDFGLSLFGDGLDLNRLGFAIKRLAKSKGFSWRFIAPKFGLTLNAGQVLKNRLSMLDVEGQERNIGKEVVIASCNGRFLIGLTLTCQDIDSYSKRDFQIPCPDPVSGMLPPKLAQIMVNLGVGENIGPGTAIYDPFCGNGRVVGEARLLGLKAFGSDLKEEQVEASQKNLQWLGREYGFAVSGREFWAQDATSPEAAARFRRESGWQGDRLYIVTEPYLGKPLRRPLPEAEGQAWLEELLPLYEKFFGAWREENRLQKMIVVFPTAKKLVGQVSLYASFVDKLTRLGYSSSVLSSIKRPDALVGRDIVEVIIND